MAVKTEREKRMLVMLLAMFLLFGYYHLCITGGAGANLLNDVFSGDITGETAAVDALIRPYQVVKKELEEEIESHKEDIQMDLQYVVESGGAALLTKQLAEKEGVLESTKQQLKDQKVITTQLLSQLVPKSDTMAESSSMRAEIAQLATALNLEILETTPVRDVEQIGIIETAALTDATGNRIKYIDGAPVISYIDAKQIHQLQEIQMLEYKMQGKAVSFFVFLESIIELPWSLFVVSMDVSVPKSNTNELVTLEMTVVLAY